MAAQLSSKTSFLNLIKERNQKYVSNTRVNAEIAWKIRLLMQRRERDDCRLINILISQSRIMFEMDCSAADLEHITDYVSRNAKWPCHFEIGDRLAYNAKYQRRDGKVITIRVRKIVKLREDKEKETDDGHEDAAQQC